MLRLQIREKSGGVTPFESPKSSVFIGRDRSMDVVLDDPLVSRQHAVIIARGAEFVLQDIGGRNPLRVNGRAVLSRVLEPGDRVEIGESVLVFDESEAGDQRPPGDFAPTVVDSRRSLEHFRDSGEFLAPPPDDTAAGKLPGAPGGKERRSQRNLGILEQFCGLVRHLSDRRKLLTTALDTVFDNLEVKRGFIGLFSPSGHLEIEVEKNQDGRRDATYSRSFVERVRQEGVAILFSDAADDSETAVRADSKSVVRLNIKCAMCLPIFRADRVEGVLYLDNRERSESFTQEDLYFANILSHLISLAVEKEELYQRIQDENIELKTILHHKNRLVGSSAASKDLLRKIKKVAGFDTTVLIVGESGTGKELVARAIHDRSPRRGEPFVAVNCAAIPETLLESELFGYAPKSGISGSDPKGKPGKFELAHGGTLFLDEIGDMSFSTQAKILRVLEEQVVDRLGGMEGIRVDLRIVAATNKVLEKAVEESLFREDLYYRLKVFKIDLKPLRERREDILPLCRHFLSLHHKGGRGLLDLSPRAKELLLAYHWPGNVRELKNCIEEAVLLSNGRTIYPENLPSDLRRHDIPQPFGTLADHEAQHIGRVLQSVNWNKRRASEILGINRSTLYEKIRLYSLEQLRNPPEEAARAEGAGSARPPGASSPGEGTETLSRGGPSPGGSLDEESEPEVETGRDAPCVEGQDGERNGGRLRELGERISAAGRSRHEA